MLPLPIFLAEVNKAATRPITLRRLSAAIARGAIPAERVGRFWFVDAKHVPTAAALLSSLEYPTKAHGPRARWARLRAARAAGAV